MRTRLPVIFARLAMNCRGVGVRVSHAWQANFPWDRTAVQLLARAAQAVLLGNMRKPLEWRAAQIVRPENMPVRPRLAALHVELADIRPLAQHRVNLAILVHIPQYHSLLNRWDARHALPANSQQESE
jgi:hypothetical protein